MLQPETPTQQPASTATPKPNKIDYPRAAILRAQGVSWELIGKEFGVAPGSVRTGFWRKGLIKCVQRAREANVSAAMVTADRTLERLNANTRHKLANVIDKAANSMDALPEPVKLKAIRAYGETAKTLVDSAAKVHDWAGSDADSLISLHETTNLLVQVAPEAAPSLPAIDAESTSMSLMDNPPADTD